MEKTFQTGSFSFRLRFPEELVLPADMEKFAVEKESADYTYTITIVDTLPEAEGELLVNRVDLQVFRNGEGLESRLIGVKGEERPYALYRETAQNHAQVFVGRWYLDGVAKYEVVFLSLLALERRLSERPCLILHCAYLEYQGKAMLFSAPSGTGKTTQAGLWEQYRGSRTVNGDKALLEYDGKSVDSKWLAGLRNVGGLREQKTANRMHCDAEPGEAEPGMAASPGRGIYKPVRTDYHEPLGSGGAGEKPGSSRASGGKGTNLSSGM